MSKDTQDPRLLKARDLLRDLAAAFDKGTWEGVHAYGKTSDIFDRLERKKCECCGLSDSRNDPLSELALTLYMAVDGVIAAKKRSSKQRTSRATA